MEAGAAGHHVGVDGGVDVLEVDVVGAAGVSPERRDRVHAGVVHVAGVEAEAGELGGDVGGDAVEFVRELDVSAGVRVNDGADAVAAGALGDGADVGDHAGPARVVEAR